jgi:hypothetical protein
MIIYLYVHTYIYIYKVANLCGTRPPPLPPSPPTHYEKVLISFFLVAIAHVVVSLVPIKGALWQIIFVSRRGVPGPPVGAFVSRTNSGGVIIFCDINVKPLGA